MNNTIGTAVTLTLFGESHGAAVGAVIDGLSPGISISCEKIAVALARRAPQGESETQRQEKDEFEILSGVFNGKSTGSPISIIIRNTSVRSDDYSYGTARPSHADYAAFCKYHGYEDYRGGGHFSGRVTAALVAAGSIFLEALNGLNIKIGTHILQCGSARDRDFEDIRADIESLESAAFPVLNAESRTLILAESERAKAEGDSVGGIVQTGIIGLPAGLGEPFFDSAESLLSHALFSIGGIKGIDFGWGFEGCTQRGSVFNDAFRMDNGRVITETNHNGGINGGISNGMPVVFRCAVKPTPSVSLRQRTVDFIEGRNTEISVHGRHDAAIIRRICPVIDSTAALVVCDMLARRFGTDVFLRKE